MVVVGAAVVVVARAVVVVTLAPVVLVVAGAVVLVVDFDWLVVVVTPAAVVVVGAAVVDVVATWPELFVGVGFFAGAALPMAPRPISPESTHTETCATFGQLRNFAHRAFGPVGGPGGGGMFVIPLGTEGPAVDLRGVRPSIDLRPGRLTHV